MRLLFFILSIPFLLWAETTWQLEREGCSVEIHLSALAVSNEQPLVLTLVLGYPETYHVEPSKIIEQLLLSINPLDPTWKIDEKSIIMESATKVRLTLNLFALTSGKAFLTFYEINFLPEGVSQQPIVIETPVFEISIKESMTNKEPLSYAPLLPLEPQYPLYLSNRNRHLIAFDKTEIEKNAAIFHTHSFPWIALLSMLLLGLAVWYGLIIRKLKKNEEIIKEQSRLKEQLFYKKLSEIREKPLSKEGYLQAIQMLVDDLSSRFSQRVTFFSPAEIGSWLEKLPIQSEEIKNRLGMVLERAYYIKYSNGEPLPTDLDNALELCTQIHCFEGESSK